MMLIKLRILLLLFSIILLISVTIVLKRGRIPIKYSLLWYFSGVIILILALVPQVLEFVSDFLGFYSLSNLVMGILISILLFLTMSLTIIVAGQKKKITLLIQEVSLLKGEVKNEDDF